MCVTFPGEPEGSSAECVLLRSDAIGYPLGTFPASGERRFQADGRQSGGCRRHGAVISRELCSGPRVTVLARIDQLCR